MRTLSALSALALVLATSTTWADSRVFIIANHPDGYGIDECLAKGDKCGVSAARAYCQSRQFAQASAFRRIDPDEVTGAVPKNSSDAFTANGSEYVAITCQR
jgi:hypothetical protein